MGYQSRASSRRASGRGYGTQRHEKSKARRRKHRATNSFIVENNSVLTTEEVVDRTLKWLSNLGRQKFISYPYSDHFSRWLVNVKAVVAEFESSPSINADDQFIYERSQILSNVEFKLKERRKKDADLDESIKNLSNDKFLLKRIKEEFAARERMIEGRRKSEIKRLNSDIDRLRSEVDSVARIKTGFFRGVSENEKRQKETETTQRLYTAERELELVMLNFTTEKENLRDKFERKKQPVK